MNANKLRNIFNSQLTDRDPAIWNVGKGKIDLPGYTIYIHIDDQWYWGSSLKQHEVDTDTKQLMVLQNKLLSNQPIPTDKSTYKLTEDQWDNLCCEYAGGVNSKILAQKYAVSRVSIYRHLAKRNIKVQRKHSTSPA